MDKEQEIILKRQYFLKRVLDDLSKGTAYGIIGWDIDNLDYPLRYRTTLSGFNGPIYVDYYENSITISGETFDKTNSPGCVSEIMDLASEIRNKLDYSTKILTDISERLKKMISDYEENGIKPKE
jgi:hypothetical protein